LPKNIGLLAAVACGASAALALMGCARNTANPAPTESIPGLVTTERLLAADVEPGEWLSHGRTPGEQRFSPLGEITTENVSGLKLAWYRDLDTARGQEATPLVIDGVLHTSTAWSKVKAYDAKTGEELWSFDPEVPGETAVNACCDVVNRGVAAYGGKIFVGTLDGRLIALDAKTGAVVWSKVTVDQTKAYTITGAPRIVKGKVVIGNGGAEFGVRGYVAAYDPENGEEVWRFYTVPGDPSKGFENAAMEMAAKTWTGEWWKLGGGGTVWDSMAYDPDTDLLYIGVGNGSPWNQAYRSPDGGDNLFLSSIVALDPDTGEYVWHFQETPGESWDYTATQHIIVADLNLAGAERKVLLHAPKNGFFYVIDAKTGAFISARNFVPVTWAKGVDPNTGRPIENPDARFGKTGKPAVLAPGPGGAHSWQPMSFSPETGLVYIPAQVAGFPYFPASGWKPSTIGFNTGTDFAAAALPADAPVRESILSTVSGKLIAWDPVKQSEIWSVNHPGTGNGGVLSTAGGLVFQGTKGGEFSAYDAKTGEKKWSFDAQTGVIAPPMSFAIEGRQHIALMVGSGGVEALAPGAIGRKGGGLPNRSRLLVFSLDGAAALPEPIHAAERQLSPPPLAAAADVVKTGGEHYGRYCGVCHGDAAISAGLVPDLRRSALLEDTSLFQEVVIGGALAANGMVSFKEALSPSDAEAIRAYLIARAHEDAALEKSAGRHAQ
jgi:alcohol dehydrogenase (cytochrome c)/quinohemoprotein ethanol dehydrogenase